MKEKFPAEKKLCLWLLFLAFQLLVLMNYIRVSLGDVSVQWKICYLIFWEYLWVFLTIKTFFNLSNFSFYLYYSSSFRFSIEGNPSCTFLRATWFVSVICCHDISRPANSLFKTSVRFMSGDGSKPLSVNLKGWRHLASHPTYRSRAGLSGYLELLRQGYSFHQILHWRHVLDDHSYSGAVSFLLHCQSSRIPYGCLAHGEGTFLSLRPSVALHLLTII